MWCVRSYCTLLPQQALLYKQVKRARLMALWCRLCCSQAQDVVQDAALVDGVLQSRLQGKGRQAGCDVAGRGEGKDTANSSSSTRGTHTCSFCQAASVLVNPLLVKCSLTKASKTLSTLTSAAAAAAGMLCCVQN